MSDVLNFRKVCARWVPRLLSENHKQQRVETARAFLKVHRRDGDQLFSQIVTGDESWVHHSTPETKRQSMVWKKPEESAPKRRRSQSIQAKLWLSSFGTVRVFYWLTTCPQTLRLTLRGVLDRLRFLPIKKMDQRTCIKFCVKNDINCADAFRMLTVAYGEATLDRSNVYRWYKMSQKAEKM
ncbi:hypothetical protein LAZ67_4001048 [Cordylochernes scorpioides]|uniref:Mos1 transposase HTH domain-containing protein n=1 Tax=Cordylochernes scorpioides TaxID=51811 RepID=A0ABY6KF28_9ARAC|nr:hypothetical protein LAZ67_4001048 [Cordylochernes scorpioides]